MCRRDGRGLAQLLRDLSALPGLRWMRILYAYPSYFDDDLVAEIAANPKVGGRLGGLGVELRGRRESVFEQATACLLSSPMLTLPLVLRVVCFSVMLLICPAAGLQVHRHATGKSLVSGCVVSYVPVSHVAQSNVSAAATWPTQLAASHWRVADTRHPVLPLLASPLSPHHPCSCSNTSTT